ncbi:MAG: dihydroorotase [Candidatus Aerophobetes bacterium]|nr:dihydroorotase [Candidatus Aerophobetes bacterium]
MSKIILKGGNVVDPANRVDKIADVLIEDGKISQIEENIKAVDAEVIDVSGKVVAPGLVDVHAHLRDPGFTYREDFVSGTKSAAAGGFTTLLAMPNTNPICDSPGAVEYVLSKADRVGIVNVLPIASITVGEEGERLTPMEECLRAGAVAFSDDGQPVTNSGLMRKALIKSKEIDKILATHCEYKSITGEGVMHEGKVSRKLGIKGIPSISEALMVGRDILLAEEIDSRVHICHVGCARSVELIREGKRREIKVSGEVIPHYLNTTEDVLLPTPAPRFKIYPPFGTTSDQEALKEGLADGTIEVIATDHAPYSLEEKARDFTDAPCGLIGFETALSVVLTELVHGKVISLSEALAKMTCNPAKIFGIDKGTLGIGKDADIVIIDLNREWRVDANLYYSKSRNCPQHGRTLKGRPVLTMVKGEIIMRDGKIMEE